MLQPLEAWENFYIIVGSSAGALTGLQFVLMSLIANSSRPGSMTEISAFGTPTVVHFCFVLLVGAWLSAPWSNLTAVALGLGAASLAGVIYIVIVTRRASRTAYRPEFSDWMWHAVVPCAGYSAIAVASLRLAGHPDSSLFVIGGGALLLIFDGIHNAWDAATYMAVAQRAASQGTKREPPGPS